MVRIIGIDPGMAICGYCVLECDDHSAKGNCIVNCGSIQTSKNLRESQRLLEIHNDLSHLLKTFKPDVAAVEKLFYFKNAKTIIPVGQARGVIIMTIEMHGIPIYEYTPLEVKQAITGYGRAEKHEVKEMVKILLDTEDKISRLDDTVDAVAIALCHRMNFD